MTPLEFKHWRAVRTHLTQDDAARLLGVNRRTIINWESNEAPIPETVEITCRYLLGDFDVVRGDEKLSEQVPIGLAMDVALHDTTDAAKIVDQNGELVWPLRYRIIVDGKRPHLQAVTAKKAIERARHLEAAGELVRGIITKDGQRFTLEAFERLVQSVNISSV